MGYIAGALAVPISFFCLWICFMVYELIKNGFEALTKRYIWHDITDLLFIAFIVSSVIIIFIAIGSVVAMLILNVLKTI
jgi:hypothetical protein